MNKTIEILIDKNKFTYVRIKESEKNQCKGKDK